MFLIMISVEQYQLRETLNLSQWKGISTLFYCYPKFLTANSGLTVQSCFDKYARLSHLELNTFSCTKHVKMPIPRLIVVVILLLDT